MSPRGALNRQRTIQDIESAFLTLYQRDGIDGVSISGICQACGIARSTFYLYFEDKFAVLQGVEDRLLSALLLLEAVDCLKPLDPGQQKQASILLSQLLELLPPSRLRFSE